MMFQPDQASALSEVDITFQALMQPGATIASLKGLTQEDIEAIYSISYNFYQQRKFEQAEQAFTFLCLYSHLDARFWIGLGASRQALRQYEGAVDAYAYAKVLADDNPIPSFQSAECFLAMNDLTRAEQALTAAINQSEKNSSRQKLRTKAQVLLKIVRNKIEETTPCQ